MSFDAATLYGLLPAWIRLRDAAQGGPLQDVVAVLADQVAVLEEDLAQSYDNLFIETCAPWARPLYRRPAASDAADRRLARRRHRHRRVAVRRSARAELPAADRAARPRRCGEDDLLPAPQDHAADAGATVGRRDSGLGRACAGVLPDARVVAGGAQSHPPRKLLRARSAQRARHRPHRRAVRRHAAHRRCAPARAGAGLAQRAQCRHLPVAAAQHEASIRSRPGASAPPATIASAPARSARTRRCSRATRRASTPPSRVPSRCCPGRSDRRRSSTTWRDTMRPAPPPASPSFYGHFGAAPAGTLPDAPGASLFVVVDGAPIPPEQVQCMNLATWRQPLTNTVGIDVALGRIALGPAIAAANVGAGLRVPRLPGRSRRRRLRPAGVPAAAVAAELPSSPSRRRPARRQFTTIAAAIAATAGKGRALISVLDSATYAEALSVALGAGESLAIEAADLQRPHLHLAAPLAVTGPADAMLTLSGLLIEGAVSVGGALARLRVLHSTRVAGAGDRAGREAGIPIALGGGARHAAARPGIHPQHHRPARRGRCRG